MSDPGAVHVRSRELAAISLDFALDADEQAELDAHLETCTGCAAFVVALRRDLASVAELPGIDAPTRVRSRVLGRAPRVGAGRRGWLAPAAALLVLVVAVAPLALRGLFSSGAAGSPVPEPSAEPSGAPTSAPTPPPGEAWAAAVVGPSGEPRSGGFAAATYIAGRGFAAVGTSCPDDVDLGCFGLAATSTDGRTWDVAPPESLPLGRVEGQQAGLRGVTVGGPGIVAVGVTGDRDGRPRAAVWLSPYGRDWEAAPDDPSFDGAWMNAVIRTRDGTLVAVGAAMISGLVDAAAWTSTDGLHWSRARPASEAALTAGAVDPAHGGRPIAGLASVAELPAGGLVGLGATCTPDGSECRGAVWSSPDGATWERDEVDAIAEGIPIAGASFEDGIAAVGRSGDAPAAWWTPDGGKWDPVAGLPDTGAAELLAVAATAGGLRAAAHPASIWASVDASEWWVLVDGEPFGTSAIAGLASGAGINVAVGASVAGTPEAWFGEAPAGPSP